MRSKKNKPKQTMAPPDNNPSSQQSSSTSIVALAPIIAANTALAQSDVGASSYLLAMMQLVAKRVTEAAPHCPELELRKQLIIEGVALQFTCSQPVFQRKLQAVERTAFSQQNCHQIADEFINNKQH